MNKGKFVCLTLAFLGVLSNLAYASPVRSGNSMILVLPARQRVVQLGFDVLSLRPRLLLIVYQGTGESDEAGMHIWNGNKWLRLRDSDYANGRFLRSGAVIRQMYLVGPENDVPRILQYRPQWAEEMQWLQSLQISDMVNVLGKGFRFTGEEWLRISEAHDLQLFESSVRHRRAPREETWPEPPPGETQRPILERLRRGTMIPPKKPSEHERVKHRLWKEVPLKPDMPEAIPDDPEPVEPAPEPELERRMLPDEKEKQIIEQPKAPLPEPVAEPLIEEDPMPEQPDEPQIKPEETTPKDDEQDITVEETATAAEKDPLEKAVDGPKDIKLTPEEIEFFELIRREFPDLDNFPVLP